MSSAPSLRIGLHACNLGRHVSTLDLSPHVNIDCLAPIWRIFARLATISLTVVSRGDKDHSLLDSLEWPSSLTRLRMHNYSPSPDTAHGLNGLPRIIARLPTALRSLDLSTYSGDSKDKIFVFDTSMLLRFQHLEHLRLDFALQDDDTKLVRSHS